MSDLLKEVDDALRAEKMEKLWKENGPYLLGGAVLLVLFTGCFTAYNNWKMNRNVSQTAIIVAAMQDKKPETALEGSVKDLKGQHKAMALLQIAGLKLQDGKAADALKLYEQVAADKSLPDLWRDLATMNAVRSEWSDKIDGAKAKELFNRLKPLTDKDNPWHLQASVQAAMIAGDNLHDPKTAAQLLRAPLQDAQAPASIKEKARMLDHLYLNASGAADKSEVKPDPKAEPKG
ncbi:MAG: hypothetical protein JWO78_1982 [Micavibrio sp.]|nr:hypothetical protein [Micavibrio sp.]